MDKTQLLSLLEKARGSQNIYIVARAALMLRGRHHSVILPELSQVLFKLV
jgi:hypothetical protein